MLALMLAASAGAAWAQTAPTDPQVADGQLEPVAEAAQLEEVQVTGSRLQNGDPTGNVIVITAEAQDHTRRTGRACVRDDRRPGRTFGSAMGDGCALWQFSRP